MFRSKQFSSSAHCAGLSKAARLSLLALCMALMAPFFPAIARAAETLAIVQGQRRMVSRDRGSMLQLRSLAVHSNVQTRILFTYKVNPDCTTGVTFTFRMVQQPLNGTVTNAPVEDLPFFQPMSAFFKCNQHKTLGLAVRYKSNPGYVGTDNVYYDVFRSDGVVIHHRDLISVQ